MGSVEAIPPLPIIVSDSVLLGEYRDKYKTDTQNLILDGRMVYSR